MAPEAVWAECGAKVRRGFFWPPRLFKERESATNGAQERSHKKRTRQKNAARGDSDGVFHFIELPKGRDSFFDEAARRVGAGREDCKRKKSPSAKKRRGKGKR